MCYILVPFTVRFIKRNKCPEREKYGYLLVLVYCQNISVALHSCPKIQFIYDLPTRLGKCIKSGAYADAVRYYTGAMPIFKVHSHQNIDPTSSEYSYISFFIEGKQSLIN